MKDCGLKEGRIKKEEATKRLKEELRIRLRRGYSESLRERAASHGERRERGEKGGDSPRRIRAASSRIGENKQAGLETAAP